MLGEMKKAHPVRLELNERLGAKPCLLELVADKNPLTQNDTRKIWYAQPIFLYFDHQIK